MHNLTYSNTLYRKYPDLEHTDIFTMVFNALFPGKKK